jgi:hypothetical protein
MLKLMLVFDSFHPLSAFAESVQNSHFACNESNVENQHHDLAKPYFKDDKLLIG